MPTHTIHARLRYQHTTRNVRGNRRSHRNTVIGDCPTWARRRFERYGKLCPGCESDLVYPERRPSGWSGRVGHETGCVRRGLIEDLARAFGVPAMVLDGPAAPFGPTRFRQRAVVWVCVLLLVVVAVAACA